MKRLIVLTLSATLLALLSGCSILANRGVQSCDTTSSVPSKLSRLRLTNLLPWRRGVSDECQTCNEGFTEVGLGDGGYANGGYIDGGYVEGTVIQGSSIPTETLYHPEFVGPAAVQPASVTTSRSFELVPTPVPNP